MVHPPSLDRDSVGAVVGNRSRRIVFVRIPDPIVAVVEPPVVLLPEEEPAVGAAASPRTQERLVAVRHQPRHLELGRRAVAADDLRVDVLRAVRLHVLQIRNRLRVTYAGNRPDAGKRRRNVGDWAEERLRDLIPQHPLPVLDARLEVAYERPVLPHLQVVATRRRFVHGLCAVVHGKKIDVASGVDVLRGGLVQNPLTIQVDRLRTGSIRDVEQIPVPGLHLNRFRRHHLLQVGRNRLVKVRRDGLHVVRHGPFGIAYQAAVPNPDLLFGLVQHIEPVRAAYRAEVRPFVS